MTIHLTHPAEDTRKTAHTPGPWNIRDDSEWGPMIEVSRMRKSICRINDLIYEFSANACLIATAPDLLDAAKDALSGWRYIRTQYGDLTGVGWDRVENALTNVISRAEGE